MHSFARAPILTAASQRMCESVHRDLRGHRSDPVGHGARLAPLSASPPAANPSRRGARQLPGPCRARRGAGRPVVGPLPVGFEPPRRVALGPVVGPVPAEVAMLDLAFTTSGCERRGQSTGSAKR